MTADARRLPASTKRGHAGVAPPARHDAKHEE
jgi:hypothetical protein